MTELEIFEGTWEECVAQAHRRAGHWVRLEVFEEAASAERLAPSKELTPDERADALIAWSRSQPPRNAPPLSDEAISRESIYFGEE